MPTKWIVIALLAATSWLCRYTVRDIGFVDLHGPTYTLEVAPQRPHRVTTDEVAELKKLTANSNVRIRSAAVDSPYPDADGAEANADSERVYVLKADHRDGALLLANVKPNQSADVINRLLHSPVQKILIDEALQTFAFMVVVESSNAERNQALQVAIDNASDQLQKLAPQLPRPIGHPVQVLRIPPAQREQEKVLLWSARLDDLAADEAAIVVYYGRAKSVGPALRGERLTQRALLSQLALIGQSCECDTDRDWAAEPSLPHAWGSEKQKAALESLGFQPDSPMVKSEVVRILNQVGKEKRVGLKDGEENANSIDNPLLGYGEFNLESGGATAQPSQADQSVSPPAGGNPMLRSASAGEGDWGFADDPTPEHSHQQPVELVDEIAARTEGQSPKQLADRIAPYLSFTTLAVVLAVAALIFMGGRRG